MINDHLHLFELVCVSLPPATADGQPEKDGGCCGSRNDDQRACAEEIYKFGGKFEYKFWREIWIQVLREIWMQVLAGNLNFNLKANLPLLNSTSQVL
jgi:hypothetical protein